MRAAGSRLAILASWVLALPSVHYGQGSIRGVVRDEETLSPLLGVVVWADRVGAPVVTGADGRYELSAVPAGMQELRLRRLGYSPRAFGVLVPAAGAVEVNVTLQPAPIRLDTRLVRAQVPLPAPPPAGPFPWSADDDWGPHPGSRLPLAEPDAFLVVLGSDAVARAEAPGGVHIRGGASDQVAFQLDGIPILNPYHTAALFGGWNPDVLSHVSLSADKALSGHPLTLSGGIDGTTRTPGDRLSARGGLSTTQARLAVDGPLGPAGIRFLVGARAGFPGTIDPKREPSYLRGETGDMLAKVEGPALGGRMRLLVYASENGVNAAAVATDTAGGTPRNRFEWQSASIGGEWQRQTPTGRLRLAAWQATTAAEAWWTASGTRIRLTSSRRDVGIVGSVNRVADRSRSLALVRVDLSTTSYGTERPGAHTALRLRAHTPVVTAVAEHGVSVDRAVQLEIGSQLSAGETGGHIAPMVRARWRPARTMRVSGSLARSHQFVQSLRNPESIVGTIFPADLYVGAGTPGVPVAQSDQADLIAEYVPGAYARLGLRAWTRTFRGLLLVGPVEGGPFATTAFGTGSGMARGVALEASGEAGAIRGTAGYALQRVRYRYLDSTYVPEHAAVHVAEASLVFQPSGDLVLHLAATAAGGRRATAASGAFEWESCNLGDQGCEFAGSPDHAGEPLGGVRLPAYLRLDLGGRKQWVLGGGRSIGFYGTMTNVLARRNILTYIRNTGAKELSAISMRSRAPLVFGMDWRF